MALIQLFDLEGNPQETWDTANGPIPSGRWGSAQDLATYRASNGYAPLAGAPAVTAYVSPASPTPTNNPSIFMGGVGAASSSPNGATTPLIAGAGNNPFGITGIGSTGTPVTTTTAPGVGTGAGTTTVGDTPGTGGGLPASPSFAGFNGGTIPGTNINLRDLKGEGAQTLAAQAALAPLMAQLYSQYAPMYAQADLNNLQTSLFGQFDAGKFYAANPGLQQEYESGDWASKGWTPAMFAQAKLGASGPYDDKLKQFYTGGTAGLNNWLTQDANKQTTIGNTTVRNANLGDVTALGGSYQGALQALNPLLYGSNGIDGALGQVAQNASSIFGNPNAYQAKLGDVFTAGPYKPGQVTPDSITSQSVTAGQLSNPLNVSATNNPLLGYAQQAAQNQMGGSGLQNDLVSQAREQLALGGQLSGEDMRNAQQGAREAWAARGLVNSPGAVGAEILNRDALSRQRMQERQAFASSVLGQEQAGQNSANSFLGNIVGQGFNQGSQNLQAQLANQQAGLSAGTTNLDANLRAQLANQQAGLTASGQNAANSLQAQQFNTGTGMDAYNQWFGQGSSLAGMEYGRGQQLFSNLLANANLQSANQFNPFSTVLGSGTSNQGLNTGLYGMGTNVSSGAAGNQGVQSMFNPYNSYSSDLYNTNTNAQASVYNTQQNNAAAKSASGNSLLGAGLGALGAIGGGLFSGAGAAGGLAKLFCWVSREAYGVDNPKWLQFRHWMLTEAPADFREWYITNGERIAEAIKDNLTAKEEIRGLMDNILEMEAA